MILSVDPSSPKSPKLLAALEAWMRQREMLDAGDISPVSYTHLDVYKRQLLLQRPFIANRRPRHKLRAVLGWTLMRI